MSSSVHNVGGWLARWAARRGARPAIADDARRLSYAELEARTVLLAGWLRRAGVGPGDRVALLLSNRSAYLEAVFAAARLGALSLPINSRLSPREVCFLFDDCAPSALLYEHDLAEVVGKASAAARTPPPLQIEVGGEPDAYEAGLAAATPCIDIHPVDPDAPMMLMYTSGTTGEPKGALLPHRKTLFNSLNAQLFFGIRAEDRVLVVAPLFHSLGLLILSLPALYAGASLVLQRHFDPAQVWDAVARERITYLGGVPTMYQQLHEELEARSSPPALESLRFLFTAGAAIPVELIHAFERRGLVLKQGYGQTETSILCCLEAEDAVARAGSVGRPVFHVELRVVALADLDGPVRGWRDDAPGEVGELVARGPITMLGYWGRPDATAETLREEGWLRTGDLATRDADGFVTLAGRARDMLISGGENVYPAEVEAVFEEHPAVQEIAVVGVADPRWGEVGRAHVVLAPGHRLDPEALKSWARDRLARFKIPRDFVAATSLPRTVTGKVQKQRLRDAGFED